MLDVQLVDPEIEFQNFWFDTSLLPGDIEVWMLEDTVREQLEKLLVEQAEAQIPPLLEESLSSLDLSFSSEVMGAPLEVSAEFASASIDSDGIALGVDLDVNIAASGSMMSAGYLAAPTVQPSPDRTAQISASIYDNLLNRVLFEGWNGGLLEMTLSTEDGSLEPIMLLPLKATQGDIAVSAGLPPVIVERNGGLALQFGELDVRIETPDGELGSSLWLTVAGEVPLNLAVESNELVLDLGTPALTMMVRDSDWGASNEAITQLVEEMLPLDLMLALVGDLSFPLPELEGIGIASAYVGRDAAQAHTNIQIALD
jgi:hypothetical protein